MTNAATYERISLDLREGAGVARQREDNTALAERRGWKIVAHHQDNDTSASGKVQRPGFEALLTGLAQGRYSVIIAWQLDRLTRNRRDTVRLIEAAQAANATIALVRGSDLDLSTPAGRMTAEILASVARNEIEQKSDRTKRANTQDAEQGKPHWRVRPFGYTTTHGGNGKKKEVIVSVVPEEAEAVRDGYDRILSGQTLADVARDWNLRGLTTTRRADREFLADGKTVNPVSGKWRGSTVRGVLVNATYRGVRTHNGREYAGSWEPLVSDDVWHAVNAILSAPERAYKGSRKPLTLLAGLALCGHCGGPLYTDHDRRGKRRYRCRTKGFSCIAEPVDAAVVTLTGELLTLPGILEAVHSDDSTEDTAKLRAERRALVIRRDEEMPQALAAGLSIAQVAEANRKINARLEEIDATLNASAPESFLAVIAAAPTAPQAVAAWREAVWDTMPLEAQRAAVRALWTVTVAKAGVEIEPTDLAERLANSVGALGLVRPEVYELP